MAYVSLYRKYRPKKFSDVVGQNITVEILKNSIINNKLGHAYIFSGPRGTGKTSVAKIFANAINCLNNSGDICNDCNNCKNINENNIDIIEIDAASNNGVDEIREIRNNTKLLPSSLKYKVYIVDEVHMLSTSAFNALLKTLEEPPSHVVFILATTEFNKIPSTVISRCQKFEFKKIDKDNIIGRLKYILNQENKKIDDNLIEYIANISDGGLRDAINLLDQVISINKDNLTKQDIDEIIGEVSDQVIIELFESLINCNLADSLKMIDCLYRQGKDYNKVCVKLENLIKDILINNSINNYFDEDYEKILCKFVKIDIDDLFIFSSELYTLDKQLKFSTNKKNLMEIFALKIVFIFGKKKLDQNQNFNESSENDKNEKMPDIPENKANVDDFNTQINLKKIKINNSLYGANKDEKETFISTFKLVKEYVSSKDFNSISSLLLKSKPEVVGKKNILFSFKNNFEVVLFDKNIKEVEKLLKILYHTKYSVVAVCVDEWNLIKKQYVVNIKNGYKYKYISEDVETLSTSDNNELKNNLMNIFGEEYINED